MRKLLLLSALGMLGYAGYDIWVHRPYFPPEGILVRFDPIQIPYPGTPRPFLVGKDVLEPVAKFQIQARVLHQEPYFLDEGSSISPVDLCLGWGLMSSNATLKYLTFTQSNRFCYYSYKSTPPILEESIIKQMANIHIIPANSAIKKIVTKLRPGQVVELRGSLVNSNRRDGSQWNTSLSRTDTGKGACELMYVTGAEIKKM